MRSAFTVFAFFAVLVTGFGAFYLIALKNRLRRFFDRPCMGHKWRSQFPAATNEEIREFLQLFTESFAISSRRKLSLSPNDRVIDIYRTIYPKVNEPDGLEVETLVGECERRYGVDITKTCGESATLGDVFRSIHKRS